MSSKPCNICGVQEATFHTEGNNPSFFCGQQCASKVGRPRVQSKTVHDDVIDNKHPLHGFINHNPWLSECIGETRTDGSVKVINKAAIRPLINHLLIGPKRGSDMDGPEDYRDPSGFAETETDTEATKSLFDKMANLKLDEIKQKEGAKPATKRQAEEEESDEKRKRTDQGVEPTYGSEWEVPIEVVSEILLALIDYDMTKMSADVTKAMTDFAQSRSKFMEYLSKLPAPTRKKMAFDIIKRVTSVEAQALAYLREKRELLVLGALLQLERVNRGSSTSFWNMQEDGSLNTLMHYAVNNNYSNLARAMYIRGASANIPNRKGVTARDLVVTFNRDPNLFSFP